MCLVRGNGNGLGGEEGRAGECVESGKGKGTAIRATGTIKRASKRNVYLPSLRAPSLSLSFYLPPSPSLLLTALSLAQLSFYMLMFSVWGVLSHLSGAQAQLKKFLALAEPNLNILIALFNRNNNSNTNNIYLKRY